MIQYLSDKQIIELNKASLGITEEKNKFHLIQPDDLRFIMRFTEKNFGTNIIKKHSRTVSQSSFYILLETEIIERLCSQQKSSSDRTMFNHRQQIRKT